MVPDQVAVQRRKTWGWRSPINGETVGEVLTLLDRDDRAVTFIGGGKTQITFKELSALTDDLAARWGGLGLRQGDRVVLILTDEQEFVLSLLAAMRAGIIAVPIYPPFVLSQRDAYLEGIRRICRVSMAACCVVSAAVHEALRRMELPCPVETYEALTAASPGGIGIPRPADPALIQFTSGSTGDPKGVVVSNRSLVRHTGRLARTLRVDGAADRALSWLPLYHDMGLIGKLLVAVVTQTSTWYMSPLRFARDPIGFLRMMTEIGGTISFAPNFAYGLLARCATDGAPAGLDLSAWRVAGCGAEPIDADTLRRFAAAYAPVGFRPKALLPCYGLAEATLAVCVSPAGRGMTDLTVDGDRLVADRMAVPVPTDAPGAKRLVSSGRPMPGTQVRIVDSDGRDVPDGTEGEIIVNSDHLASGYFADEESTAQTWRNGWLWTGDTGFLHEGELYVTGRSKDLIIVNGRNYQPHDIERAAEQVDGVRPSNVVALAGPHGDTEAVRLVFEAQTYPPKPELAADVAQVVRRQFAVPIRDITVVRKGALPKTSSGKIRRRHTALLLNEGRLSVVAVTRS
ncbi:fatty acyl-AMP ligase [Actinomadura miaoliensis]|uniref:fatty acyl-AMP ligase n=1 Tax=Actinomadura miaoliensis TaxID=430685 RepID=UPI0031EEC0B9